LYPKIRNPLSGKVFYTLYRVAFKTLYAVSFGAVFIMQGLRNNNSVKNQ